MYGSSEAADTLLFCVDYGEAYHSFCTNAPIHGVSDSAVTGLTYTNIKVCKISGEVQEDETKLLYYKMYEWAFSSNLMDPMFEIFLVGLWICGQCVDCGVCGNDEDGGRVSQAW